MCFPPVLSEARSSHACVAGLAGRPPAPQVDSRAGFGPVLTVSLTAGRPVVVVDLRPPSVCGDDPRGGPPLLQRIRSFDALLDLFSGPPQGSIWRHQALPWKTGRRPVRTTSLHVECNRRLPPAGGHREVHVFPNNNVMQQKNAIKLVNNIIIINYLEIIWTKLLSEMYQFQIFAC